MLKLLLRTSKQVWGKAIRKRGAHCAWVKKLKTASENTSLIFVQSFLKQLTVSLHSMQTSRQARADSKSNLSRRIARASGTFLKRFSQSSWLEPCPRDRLFILASNFGDMLVGAPPKTETVSNLIIGIKRESVLKPTLESELRPTFGSEVRQTPL